ncbi:MAG: PAS domain S-box protein [Deltaproteobacteria bacterium]|nr:MAG: PAS domain S-box protein [Deltaproteobacteria bacterium]
MRRKRAQKISWISIPPWLIVGAVIILMPIFVFWTLRTIHKQKESTTFLLLEKGAALIRSFEAGARTGMMGMMGMQGGRFQLQKLLTETAQQPDIAYIIVTDFNGTILAHNDPARIGGVHGKNLDLERISLTETVEWRLVINLDGGDTFEVFRQFAPTGRIYWRFHGRTGQGMMPRPDANPLIQRNETRQLIFVGLDMGPIEAARKEDMRHTVLMALILLLIGFAGIVSLFLAQAYRSTRASLTRIKAFSDTLVENMPIGLVAIDADRKVASFNQTAEAVLDLSSREVLGKNAHKVLPQHLWSLIDELDTKESIVAKEIDCALGDRRVIPMDVSISLLEGDEGNFLGYIILFRDMTEVKNLKKEIERNQRLASLGRLAAGIAHEIRNPLSSIKGFATYFGERYKDTPEDQKTAEIMVQEVERLNRVIGQLLELARPMTILKKPTSLHTLIQHSLKMIEGQAREKNIKISTSLSPEIKDISIDPDRINQVLLNLYLNALEAMEQGGTLLVELSWDESSQRTKIVVSDTGGGITKEDLARIFDPYFTTKQSGTGLGLAIVHNIIESHGGEISVDSERGKGTTVTIFLPVAIEGNEGNNREP